MLQLIHLRIKFDIFLVIFCLQKKKSNVSKRVNTTNKMINSVDDEHKHRIT